MHWSDEMLDGWLLAQAMHDAPPDDVLLRDVARRLQDRRSAIQAQTTEIRRQNLRRIAQLLKPNVAHTRAAAFPARMKALLATEVPRELGTVWINHAAPPRQGFQPSGVLLQTLRALSQEKP